MSLTMYIISMFLSNMSIVYTEIILLTKQFAILVMLAGVLTNFTDIESYLPR